MSTHTGCVNSLVSRFGQKLLLVFPRPVGETAAAVQPGRNKIVRGTSAKTFYQTLIVDTDLLTHFVVFHEQIVYPVVIFQPRSGTRGQWPFRSAGKRAMMSQSIARSLGGHMGRRS